MSSKKEMLSKRREAVARIQCMKNEREWLQRIITVLELQVICANERLENLSALIEDEQKSITKGGT